MRVIGSLLLTSVDGNDLFLASPSDVESPTCGTPYVFKGLTCTRAAHHKSTEISADACCAACSLDAKCDMWEFMENVTTGNNCHLKTGLGALKPQANVTSGVMSPPPAPPPPARAGSPNIVWLLTDDQDQKLGGSFPMHDGVGPMPKTQKLLVEKGAMAENWFVHTPICCPSRAELVTGRYYHNLKEVGGKCMHINETKVNNHTFAWHLKQAGYTVGMFGKYLNLNPKEPPLGVDAYMTNGGGTYFHPQFDTKGVTDLPPYYMLDGSWTGQHEDYTTAVVGNMSMSWIRKVAKGPWPFMAYIAPKAAHEPFTPAAWYNETWLSDWPTTEPRPVSWNCSMESRKDHHGNIAKQKMITAECADYITDAFKNRWRTLMSVDDLVEGVVNVLEELDVADNTYIMYSSDHGFQLGEFNILIDKRHMYDHDIRVHLLVRGPGIKAGSTFPHPGTNVDIAVTWLGMAGLGRPVDMDGRSFLPLLVDADDKSVPKQTRQHLAKLAPGGRDVFAATWRDHVFIEYYYNAANPKCHGYATENIDNNWIGVRYMPGSEFGDISYAEYMTGSLKLQPIDFEQVDFVEYFNLTEDDWQMKNLWNISNKSAQMELSKTTRMWFACEGDTCM